MEIDFEVAEENGLGEVFDEGTEVGVELVQGCVLAGCVADGVLCY